MRIAILGLGSLFLFALTIEVIKKRFHMNVITSLLQDIEAKGFGLEEKFRFPLGTKGIDKYIERKSHGDPKKKPDDYSDPVFKLFKMSYARKYLTYVILIAAISLALLAEWEFIKFGEYNIWFYIVGIVVVIAPVTATISFYVYYKMREDLNVVVYRAINEFNKSQDRSGYFGLYDSKSLQVHGFPANLPSNFEGMRMFYDALWHAFPDSQLVIDDLIVE